MTSHVDLADARLYALSARHEVWERNGCPVTRETSAIAGDFWSVTGSAEADAVLRNPACFRSGAGNTLRSFIKGEPAAGKMLVTMDAPRHGEIRRELASLFSPRGVRRLERMVRRIVVEAIEHACAARRVDWVGDVAARIPVDVTAEVLGIPEGLRPALAKLSDAAFGADDASAAHAELLAIYAELLEDRRRRPADDVASLLATGTFGGRPLDDEEAMLNCHVVLLGGNETTRHAIAGGTLGLIESPREWARLAGGFSIDEAVEEILRWTSPAMHVARAVGHAIRLDGSDLSEGDRVVVWLAAANRDPLVHTDPNELRLDRRPRHLSFGSGPHHCLGAAVARLELSIFFEELLARIARIEPTGEPTYLRSNFIGGLVAMPVEVYPK